MSNPTVYNVDYFKVNNMTFTSTFGTYVKVPVQLFTSAYAGGTNQFLFPYPATYQIQFQVTGSVSQFLFVMYDATSSTYIGSTTSSAGNYSVQQATFASGGNEKTISLIFPITNASHLYELRVQAALTTDTLSFKTGQVNMICPFYTRGP